MPKLNTIKSNNTRKSRTRVGRGNGSKGTYSGRGIKGQKSRSGGGVPIFFEGGQLPLVKRLPFLRGFKNRFKTHYSLVNLASLEANFKNGDVVDPKSLSEKKLIRKESDNVKILGRGEITKKLTISAHAASKSAQEKISKSGSQIKFIPLSYDKNSNDKEELKIEIEQKQEEIDS